MHLYDRDGRLHQMEHKRRNIVRGLKFAYAFMVALFALTWLAFIAIGIWQNGVK
jgi:hypothetical protein